MAEWVIDLDGRIGEVVASSGPWAYLVVAVLIAAQAVIGIGWLIPGNALIFTVGMLASAGAIQAAPVLVLSVPLTVLASICCYGLGRATGERLLGRYPERLAGARAFFAKHGTWTMVLAPYVPFLRGIAPVVAGVGKMPFATFAVSSAAGFGLWISLVMAAGAALGEVTWIRDNLGLTVIGVGLIVAARALWALLQRRKAAPAQVL